MLLAEQAPAELRLRGQQVRARVTVFVDEARRRRETGLMAVDRRALLTLLYELPVGLPVPLDSLDLHDQRALRAAPRGVVELDEEQRLVVRRVVPAARVELVVLPGQGGVPAGNWDSAVWAASQFAPFCARAVVVAGQPETESDADRERLLIKARFYGVGVATGEGRGLRWLLEPARYRPRRHSAAQWLFHEQAWRQLGPDRPRFPGSSGNGKGSGLVRRHD